jgi:hypothetical protein
VATCCAASMRARDAARHACWAPANR